ncbi:putative quinol monooxygenase [Chloroflexota bacterium]
MYIIHVHVHVKPEFVDNFKQATLINAKSSIKEPGVARFDVIQERDDPTRFVLIEIYRTKEDPSRHKETAHYLCWREKVAEMMAEPRKGIKYMNLYPDDESL